MDLHLSATDVAGQALILMGGQFAVVNGATPGTTVENTLLHNWFSSESVCTNGQTGNNCSPGLGYGTVWGVASATNIETDGSNSYVFYNGSKATGDLLTGCEGCGELKNSKIHNGWMGCSSCITVHDNEFYGISQSTPCNLVGCHSHIIYEDNQSVQDTVAVYNNYIHDSSAGVNINIYFPAAIYNNVMGNMGHATAILGETVPATNTSSGVGYVANNTFDLSAETSLNPCYGWDSRYPQMAGTLYFQNNVCIPNATGTGGFNAATVHAASNYTMTTSEAGQYGFTPANKYAPTSSDPNVTSKGVNMVSLMSGLLSTVSNLQPIQYDAAGAPWFGGSYEQRTSSWDLGAFVVGGQSASTSPASKPNPPSGLAVSVD